MSNHHFENLREFKIDILPSLVNTFRNHLKSSILNIDSILLWEIKTNFLRFVQEL